MRLPMASSSSSSIPTSPRRYDDSATTAESRPRSSTVAGGKVLGEVAAANERLPWSQRHLLSQRVLSDDTIATAVEHLLQRACDQPPSQAHTHPLLAPKPILVDAVSQWRSSSTLATLDCSQYGFVLDAAISLYRAHSRYINPSTSLSVHRQEPRQPTSTFVRLSSLPEHLLADSDFSVVSRLQRSPSGIVDVVRCRFDRRLYVLKSMLKGVAKREPWRTSPLFERKLLENPPTPATSQLVSDPTSSVTPRLVASFQSPGSLHVVMEYFPGGDLDSLLEAAGQARPGSEGKRTDGGMLKEAWVKEYAIDMVAAVGWCHAMGFAHRDIKPSNFLLSSSGRIKLCDFGASAPFTSYDAVALASVHMQAPESGPDWRPTGPRRVQHFYTIRPAGTCDYIAPEILRTEEERVRTFQSNESDDEDWDATHWDKSAAISLTGSIGPRKRALASSQSDHIAHSISTASMRSRSSASKPRKRRVPPAGDSPGSYGPEVDWWSVGVVLYEMTYGQLPFWTAKAGDAWLKIRDHEQHFHLDERITLSTGLADLLKGLLSRASRRLGRLTTSDIQTHSFFADVDWTRHTSRSPPFLPNLAADPAATANSAAAFDLSPLHSPRSRPATNETAHAKTNSNTIARTMSRKALANVQSGQDSRTIEELPSLAQMWDGDADDFPVFPDELEVEAAGTASTSARTPARLFASGDGARCASEASVSAALSAWQGGEDTAPPSDDQEPASGGHETSSLSDVSLTDDADLTWLGFSYQPPPTSFLQQDGPPAANSQQAPKCSMGTSPSGDSMSGALPSDAGVAGTMSMPSSHGPPARTDVRFASEPQVIHLTGDPHTQRSSSEPITSTPPLHPSTSTPYNAAARSLQRQAVETAASRAQAAIDFRARPHAFQTPLRKTSLPNIASISSMPVPPSPYPFPVAASGPPPSTLRRKDLARARSSSLTPSVSGGIDGAGGSMGSDSRCSGGSNARRDQSEQAAFTEMMRAVHQSAKKLQSGEPADSITPAIPGEGVRPLRRPLFAQEFERRANEGRPDMVRSSTEPSLAVPTTLPPDATTLSAPASAAMIPRSSTHSKLASWPHIATEAKLAASSPQQVTSAKLIRRDSCSSESSISDSPVLVHIQSKAAAGAAGAAATVSQSSPAPSSSLLNAYAAGGKTSVDLPRIPSLRHRHSNRALLMKAQMSATPTKSTRASSPALNVAGDQGEHDRSEGTQRRGTAFAPRDSNEGSHEADTASTRLRLGTRLSLEVPHSQTDHAGLPLHLSSAGTQRTIVRKGSGEMLSEYRLGLDGHGRPNVSRAPTATNGRRTSSGGAQMLGMHASMTCSSPSLPSFGDADDAFGSGLANVTSRSAAGRHTDTAPRRASFGVVQLEREIGSKSNGASTVAEGARPSHHTTTSNGAACTMLQEEYQRHGDWRATIANVTSVAGRRTPASQAVEGSLASEHRAPRARVEDSASLATRLQSLSMEDEALATHQERVRSAKKDRIKGKMRLTGKGVGRAEGATSSSSLTTRGKVSPSTSYEFATLKNLEQRHSNLVGSLDSLDRRFAGFFSKYDDGA